MIELLLQIVTTTIDFDRVTIDDEIVNISAYGLILLFVTNQGNSTA
jgi:hypothetical protein